jgi:hypothetical protein
MPLGQFAPIPLAALTSAMMACAVLCSGCGLFPTAPGQQAMSQLPNPLEIPVSDREFVWNEIVDTVDDYFDIAREERVRLVGNVLTEGRIETYPATGASVMDIWRKDAIPGFELWQSTFQSIRRQAVVRVSPAQSGYGVQVVVRKELEDLARPELATVGGAVQRYDGTLVRPQDKQMGSDVTLGWIPLGRDVELEQKILADLYARLHQVESPPPVQTLHQ